MDLAQIIVIVFGLTLFEAISSIDNAVINADVLGTMSAKSRRWFLSYGLIAAILLVRGILPLLIIYFSDPSIGIVNAFIATFSSNAQVQQSIELTKPVLLGGGGVYLIFIFLYWLFAETKEYAFFIERHIHKHYYFWFYAVASIVLLIIVAITMKINPLISLGAVIGSTAFFITNGFKQNAEKEERKMVAEHLSAISKLIYLELIDMSFSIDGVLGAFAFTLSVPLILLGNGFGAFVVRYFTVHGVEIVKKYRYLKNGAMYSVGVLGLIMVLESFGLHTYEWMPALTTLIIISVFFWLSTRELEVEKVIK